MLFINYCVAGLKDQLWMSDIDNVWVLHIKGNLYEKLKSVKPRYIFFFII